MVAHGARADHDHAVYTSGRGDWPTLTVGAGVIVQYVTNGTVGIAVSENAQLAWRW